MSSPVIHPLSPPLSLFESPETEGDKFSALTAREDASLIEMHGHSGSCNGTERRSSFASDVAKASFSNLLERRDFVEEKA